MTACGDQTTRQSVQHYGQLYHAHGALLRMFTCAVYHHAQRFDALEILCAVLVLLLHQQQQLPDRFN